MTGYERSGWRDLEISSRHRRWGFNCPAADLDFLMVEYHLGQPVALVDYKHYRAGIGNYDHPTYVAAGRLYDDRHEQIPLIVCRYWPDVWAVRAVGLNAAGQRWLPTWRELTERQWVAGLHNIRKVNVDERVLAACRDELPPQEDVA